MSNVKMSFGLANINWARGALLLAGLYVAAKIILSLARRQRLAALAKASGCSPARQLPSRDPILGLDTFYGLLKSLRGHAFLPAVLDVFDKAGDKTFYINTFGDNAIWTSDTENFKAIFATQAKDWGVGKARSDSFDPFFGQSIVTSNGEVWANSRHIIRPNFTRKQITDTERFDKHYSIFRSKLPTDGRVVDLDPLFHQLSMDVSSELLFGVSTNLLSSQGETESKKFAETFDFVLSRLITKNIMGKMAVLIPDPKFDAGVKFLCDFLDRFIGAALASFDPDAKSDDDSDRYLFVHEMVRSWRDRPARIRSEQFALLVAGRDTTANTLSNLFHRLARRPDVWAKLRREAVAGPEAPSFEELKDMKYHSYVLKEALRLIPATPDITRTSLVDTVLPRGGGPSGRDPVYVAAGTNLRMWLHVAHRDADFWGGDAATFRPERWFEDRPSGLKESSSSTAGGESGEGGGDGAATTTRSAAGSGLKPGWHYVPFGGGPRICLGQQFALAEMQFVLYRLAREFVAIEAEDPDREWVEKMGITVSSFEGTRVRLVRA